MKSKGLIFLWFCAAVAFCGGCGPSNPQPISAEAAQKIKDMKPGYTPAQRMDIRKRMMSGMGVQKTPGGAPPAAGQ